MTEDCLKRQNKSFECLPRDLTAMFVRHCPDPELSLIFKCKPLSQWSVTEVHERLVGHCGGSAQTPRVRMLAPAPTHQQRQEVKSCMQQLPQAVVSAQSLEAGRPDNSGDRLDRIVSMLDQVLDQRPWRSEMWGGGGPRARQSQAPRRRNVAPCVICGDGEHTTHYHCRVNRLCFG